MIIIENHMTTVSLEIYYSTIVLCEFACRVAIAGYTLIFMYIILAGIFSHVLLLLVKVPLIVFLCYGLDVDVSVPLSQPVALGKYNVH